MKKFLGTILVLIMSAFPMIGKAATKEEIDISKYETLNLKEALAQEKIEEEFETYGEKDDQIAIYLFRGNGCGYCKAFLTFLNTITDEYGKYFKLVSFETWYDKNNSALLDTVSEFLGNPAQGVPYIIIGENVFPGYASDYDESIKEAIKTLYESKDRYDVFEEYNKTVKDEAKKESSAMNKVIIWNFVFTAISTAIIVITIKMNFKGNNLNTAEEFDDYDNEDNDDIEEEKKSKKKINKKNKQ